MSRKDINKIIKDNINEILSKYATESLYKSDSNCEFVQSMLYCLFLMRENIHEIEKGLLKRLSQENKEKSQTTIFVPKDSKPNNPKDDFTSLKVGKIAQVHLMPLLESKQWNDKDLETFLSKETKNIFDLNIPLLSVSRYVYTKEGKKYTRYYKKPIKVNGTKYFMCSQWNINNELLKEQLINFIQKHS